MLGLVKSIIGSLIVLLLNIIDQVLFAVIYMIKGNDWLTHDLRAIGTKKFATKGQFVGAPANEKETAALRNAQSPNKLLESPAENILTMADLFNVAVEKHKHKNCMGQRPIIKIHNEYHAALDGSEKQFQIPEFGDLTYQSYDTVDKRINVIGSGVVQFAHINSGDRLGFFEETCQEWMMTAQACFRYNITVVTVYSNLGDEGMVQAFNETKITSVFTNGSLLENFKKLYKQLPHLKYIIYNKRFKGDTHQDEIAEQIRRETNIKVILFEDLEALGASASVAPAVREKAATKSVACIMYTSGTTGQPKGVIITHGNMLGAVAGMQNAIGNDPNVPIIYLGYLPLAHILELVAEHFVLLVGGSIGYGSPRTLTEKGARPFGDLHAVKPVVMPGVPRVWDTVKKNGSEKITKKGAIAAWLFDHAFQARKKALAIGRDTPLWNLLVFNAFKSVVGGRMQLVISGGASLAQESQEFIRVCLGCSVIQGYGLTETCAATALQNGYHEFTTRRVGAPTPCNEVKLVSVDEMSYHVTDKPNPRGEIWVRGTNISQGYYNQPEKTKEEFLPDGWFKTGDVGEIYADGSVAVIDRKKNLVKLDHGEYVALERLESIYMASSFVSPNGIMVYGDSDHSDVVAIVIPQATFLIDWAKQNNIPHSNSLFELCKNTQVTKTVLEEFKALGKKNALKSFEIPKSIRLVPDEWTPENSMLTASQKLNRRNIVLRYKQELMDLYK